MPDRSWDGVNRVASSLPPPAPRFRLKPRCGAIRLLSCVIFCVLLLQLLGNWTGLMPVAVAASIAQSSSSPGHNTFQQFLKTSQPSQAQPSSLMRAWPPACPVPLPVG
jgi:hypothetical protein